MKDSQTLSPPHNLLQFVPVIAEYGFLRLTQLIQGLFVFIKMLFVIFLERFLLRLDRLDVFTIEYGLEDYCTGCPASLRNLFNRKARKYGNV